LGAEAPHHPQWSLATVCLCMRALSNHQGAGNIFQGARSDHQRVTSVRRKGWTGRLTILAKQQAHAASMCWARTLHNARAHTCTHTHARTRMRAHAPAGLPMTDAPEPRSEPQSANSDPDSTDTSGACNSAVASIQCRPLPTPPSAHERPSTWCSQYTRAAKRILQSVHTSGQAHGTVTSHERPSAWCSQYTQAANRVVQSVHTSGQAHKQRMHKESAMMRPAYAYVGVGTRA